MKLNLESLVNQEDWNRIGVETLGFQVGNVVKYTMKNPIWVHFGAGNIFRAYIAELQQRLLNRGLEKSGIIAVDTFDYDIIDKIYKPHDNLTMLVSMNPDGKLDKKIIGSVTEALKGDFSCEEDSNRLKEIFRNPGLQMISFTITEKGYALTRLDGTYLPVVMEDIKNGPSRARHAVSFVVSLLYERYSYGKAPLAVVSLDNCSHNGEKLKNSVMTIAKEWKQAGFVEQEFLDYLEDEEQVSFPWSMIDKITPRPADEVKEALLQSGIEGMEPIITSKNTYIAAYVNAEVPQYMVIEDQFPNGRPKLHEAGVYFTDRDTVNQTERMKVTTCLNPLHTALAVYGCLLGYTSIAAEMKDEQLKKLVEKIGYQEGMPVVVDPVIINPQDFIHEVIEVRLPNPYIPDMPQRIATDTSQKVGIRFGETIKSYMERKNLNAADLIYIPLAIAGWFRYLLGVDDFGKKMELSPDPMLEQLRETMAGIEIGRPETYKGNLKKLLSSHALFGVDLFEAGLGDRIEAYFLEMIHSTGSVRTTLKKYLN